MEIKLRLREIREDFGYSQQYVANYLHIRQNTYSQYETGKRELPLSILILLSQFYQTTTDYLLGL